jgi:hypothetical protein
MRYSHAALRLTRVASSWFLLCLIALSAACGGGGDPTGPVLSVNIEAASLEIGGTVQLSARNATTTVTWTSSNTAVATVVSTGFVTAVGPGTATITATAGSASASSTITVLAPPVIALSGTTASFTARAGTTNPAAQTITISNGGPGTLQGIALSTIQYAGGAAGWLTATLNGNSATATQTASVQLTAAVTGLAPGAYTAIVPITATGAPNSPQNINVTFTVTPRPTLELSRTAVAISTISGAANPAPETVNLTSSTSAPAAGLAASIAYNEAAQAGWLTATVNPNTTPSTLTLQASAGARPAGTYTATVTVTSTDASNAPRQVTVTFTVVPAPRIDVNQPTLSFGAPLGGANPTAQTIQITNGGGGTLTGLTATPVYTNGAGWLTLTLTPGTNAGSVLVQPNIAGLAAGTYAANVRITATGASNTPRDVAVTLTISSQPTIAVNPVSLNFASSGATPAAQLVTITNSGGGTLGALSTQTQYTSGNNWLTVVLNTAASPATVSVQPNITGLAAGTYSATVRILSVGASNTPVSIPVQLTITTPPSIVLNRSSVTFGAVIGEGDPLAEAVTITNGGGGSLTGLAANISYTIVGQSWLNATFNTTTATSTLTLSAARGSLPVGTYTATVNVTSGVASNSPRPISVTFNVTQPSMTVGNAAPSFTQASGNGNATVLAIPINGTGGQVTGLARSIINYMGPVPNNNWLTATLNGSASPTTITLTANAGTPGAPRTPGDYTATVRLTSANASNSPVDINVTFTVEVSMANNLFNQIYGDPTWGCINCHFALGSFPDLSTPARFRDSTVNVVPRGNPVTYQRAASPNRLVVPGDPTRSYLMYMLDKDPQARPMPSAGVTVPQSLRDLMRTWILQGAKNN